MRTTPQRSERTLALVSCIPLVSIALKNRDLLASNADDTATRRSTVWSAMQHGDIEPAPFPSIPGKDKWVRNSDFC